MKKPFFRLSFFTFDQTKKVKRLSNDRGNIQDEQVEQMGAVVSFLIKVISYNTSWWYDLASLFIDRQNDSKSILQCDMRSTIIRVAPAPLYNSFMDVWRFVAIVDKLTQS